jgi:hypothetical protein
MSASSPTASTPSARRASPTPAQRAGPGVARFDVIQQTIEALELIEIYRTADAAAAQGDGALRDWRDAVAPRGEPRSSTKYRAVFRNPLRPLWYRVGLAASSSRPRRASSSARGRCAICRS